MDKLSANIQNSINLLGKFVFPIYRNDTSGRPEIHGSGFFVKKNDNCYFVSAAHVLDGLKERELYIYIDKRTIKKLGGNVLLTPSLEGRAKDKVDLGVIKVIDKVVPPYREIEKLCVPFEYITLGWQSRYGRNYAIVGFPATKSKANVINREVVTKLYCHQTRSIDESEYRKLDLDVKNHIALPLDLKKVFDLEQNKILFPKPQGMSGSPIWELYNDKGVQNHFFPLVGIGIEYLDRPNVLVGTDVSHLINMINFIERE